MVCDAGSVRNAAGDHRKAEYRSPPNPGASRSRRTHERDRTDQFQAGGVGGFPPQRNEAVGAGDPEAWTERRLTGTRGSIVARRAFCRNAKPKFLNYASSDVGTTSFLSGEIFKLKT